MSRKDNPRRNLLASYEEGLDRPKHEQIQEMDIFFFETDAVYAEGSEVSGEVMISVIEDMIIEKIEIQFHGTAVLTRAQGNLTISTRQSTPVTMPTTDEETHLDQKFSLHHRYTNTKNIKIPAGRHAYPFKVQLPINLPSSIEGKHGYCRYAVVVVMERPWLPNKIVQREFLVYSLLDLSSIPRALKPLSGEKNTTEKGMCCVVGGISAVWHLPRMGYIPGDELTIDGEVSNNSRVAVRKSKATLLQHIRYHDSIGHSVEERRSIASIERGEVKPGRVDIWKEKMIIPPLPPTGLKCNLMDLWYTLKMKVYAGRMMENLLTHVDIIVGTNVGHRISPNDSLPTPSPLIPHQYATMDNHATDAPVREQTSKEELDLTYFA